MLDADNDGVVTASEYAQYCGNKDIKTLIIEAAHSSQPSQLLLGMGDSCS